MGSKVTKYVDPHYCEKKSSLKQTVEPPKPEPPKPEPFDGRAWMALMQEAHKDELQPILDAIKDGMMRGQYTVSIWETKELPLEERLTLLQVIRLWLPPGTYCRTSYSHANKRHGFIVSIIEPKT
jgi:hypothetical protein